MKLVTTFLLCVSLMPAAARAFVCLHADSGACLHWAQNQATLNVFLGGAGMQLENGTTSWDQNAVNAANDWNAVGADFHFNAQVGGQFNEPCGSPGPGHACPNTGPAGDNPVLFRQNFCGRSFDPDVIELTNNCWDASGAMINAPVFVKSDVPWNAYDGPIQCCVNQPPEAINDMRRVLLHEFGHVLGLDHPDDPTGNRVPPQNVVAIMNSRESDLDRLQPDDIAGMLSIYPRQGTDGNPQQGPATNPSCQVAPVGSWNGLMLAIPALLVLVWRGNSPRVRANASRPTR